MLRSKIGIFDSGLTWATSLSDHLRLAHNFASRTFSSLSSHVASGLGVGGMSHTAEVSKGSRRVEDDGDLFSPLR